MIFRFWFIIHVNFTIGKARLELAKMIGRYHQTVMNFVRYRDQPRWNCDKGKLKTLSPWSVSHLKRKFLKIPFLSSDNILSRCGSEEVSNSPNYHIGNQVAKYVQSITASFNWDSEGKSSEWTTEYIKTVV